MYVPKHFEATDRAQLLEVMRTYNFATLVNTVDGYPYATHLPVLARESDGGWLIDAHVAAANPQWRALKEDPRALVVFQGPHAYISPSNYRSNRRVPTWNYLAVHAQGRVRVLEDEADKRVILDRLIAFHEPEFAGHFATFEEGMTKSLFGAIIGLEIEVEKLEGKFKLNQHRLADDRAELAAEFAVGDENHRAIAEWMRKLGHWQPPG